MLQEANFRLISIKTQQLCISAVTLFHAGLYAQATKENQEVYGEFNYGQNHGGENWIQSIKMSEPAYRAEVEGDVMVRFRAPGMTFAKALCWQQSTEAKPSPWGHDENLTPDGMVPGEDASGSFFFPAEDFPNGPVNIRIFGEMLWASRTSVSYSFST